VDVSNKPLSLVAVVVAVAGFGTSAEAIVRANSPHTRPPTMAERIALEDATYRSAVGDKAIIFVRVSLADSHYAIVGWRSAGQTARDGLDVNLFRRVSGHWRFIYEIGGRPPGYGRARADGACAVAPARIVQDLYGYRCSFTWRQLHARPATRDETRLLQAALDRYYGGSSFGRQHLIRACVSRVAPAWAAGQDTLGLYEWFKKRSRGWVVVHSEGDTTPTPPHAVVLSLGSCVGYFPSDYYR